MKFVWVQGEFVSLQFFLFCLLICFLYTVQIAHNTIKKSLLNMLIKNECRISSVETPKGRFKCFRLKWILISSVLENQNYVFPTELWLILTIVHNFSQFKCLFLVVVQLFYNIINKETSLGFTMNLVLLHFYQ